MLDFFKWNFLKSYFLYSLASANKSLLSIFFFFYSKESFITCVPNTLLSAEEYLKIRFYPNKSQSSGAVRLKNSQETQRSRIQRRVVGGRAALRAFELGPVEQYNFDGLRRGRKAFLAVEQRQRGLKNQVTGVCGQLGRK